MDSIRKPPNFTDIQTLQHSPRRYRNPGEGEWMSKRSLIPVPVQNSHNPQQRYSVQSVSLWYIFTAWLHYQSIQIRWGIERFLARLLHRRWTG